MPQLQARFDVARFGASRFNYFTPNGVVMIAGVDRTDYVGRLTTDIVLTRNGGPNTARFVVERNAVFTPETGQLVAIGLGSSSNPIFGGSIVGLEPVRDMAADRADYAITCMDWTKQFNRRRITALFSGESASAIATAIVENYTNGFTHDIQSGLATIAEFVCINETPQSAMTRLANLIGGGCICGDANKVVRLWTAFGPGGVSPPTNPVPLMANAPVGGSGVGLRGLLALYDSVAAGAGGHTSTLRSFTPAYDESQRRTMVAVEGRSGKTVVAIPAFANLATYGIPIDHDGQWFFNPNTDAEANYARLGTLIVSYDHIENVLGPPFTFVAVAGSVGDTTLEVTPQSPPVPSGTGPFWLYDGGENYFVCTGVSPTSPNDTLTGIPATGYGSIIVDLPVGAPLYQTGVLSGVAELTNHVGIEQGDAVVVRVQVDDAAAQAAIVANEGGDGIYEHTVADGDLTYLGCLARARAELESFSGTLVSARWSTLDMNALPGTTQVIGISAPDPISTNLIVDTVRITFPYLLAPPLRECDGSTVKLATIFDAIKG